MLDKDKYDLFCKEVKEVPVFSRNWWLDAVCGSGNWDVVLVERGEEIVAAMPFSLEKKFGLKVSKMPPLTQTLGVWIKYPQGQKYASRLSYEKEIFTEIIEKMPKFDIFEQNFHYTVTNWLPFYWKGFSQTTRYTYIIEGLADLDYVFSEFKSNVRNKIRKAEKIVVPSEKVTLEEFYALNRKTFHRQKKKVPYGIDLLRRMDDALRKRGRRRVFGAIDEEGRLHSALYLIWDDTAAYVHMVGEDPGLRSSGAGILLLWEAIKFTANTLKLEVFDFEGSMLEPVEEVRRAFGARQTPYFTISKIDLPLIFKMLYLLFRDK
ncbi:MAG: GNAT family N-acetyltransferase [Candidatus Omnitrophica bacterium]|nr:GNAT family N-acetyltransferase [Candidatus Omnitrophota bacterium]